jgi:hypothetical protein
MLWLVRLRFNFIKIVFFLKRRASSSTAVAANVNQRTAPQKKSGQFGIPQRLNLPKESINVR